MSERPLSFDLVVATLGRDEDLGRFLDSVDAQAYEPVRVLVVDQNDDDRVERIVAGRALETVVLRSKPGLSRARNVALPRLEADVVAFPDDDCTYPPGLLAVVAARFAADPTLDGLTGRAEDAQGRSSPSWKRDVAVLTDDNLWNRANAATMFLRRSLVEGVGPFDERLGLGSGEPWASGEETDYLIRAVRTGARLVYEPALVVRHDVRADTGQIGLRDGASLGYLLGKHHYPARTVARMLTRPLGGAARALVRLDLSRSRYYLASEVGRTRGYLAARRSNSAS